jgi:hypothetical protein
MMLIQFDADPQQVLLGNLQTGMQIVATVNVENIIDGIAINGRAFMASALGEELLKLLANKGSLVNTIDPSIHIANIRAHKNVN